MKLQTLACVFLCLATGCARPVANRSNPSAHPPLNFRPNFVFILTDDQDRMLGKKDVYTNLGSLDIMPSLKSRLLDEGSIVENFMVNTPICCPSRTEFFTGRYFHNVGPPGDKNGTCMHADTTMAGSNETGMFGVFKKLGYNVGVFGKVTNDQQRILTQMSNENAATMIDAPIDINDYMGRHYYQYWSTNQSTHTETLPLKAPVFKTAYQTTQIGNRTLRWLENAIDGESPFLAYIGPHAPHYPAQPAPWYEHAFDNVKAPRTPNYNLSSPGKAQHVRQNPPLDAQVKCWENQHFRDRWSSLLSVDDIIEDVYTMLREKNALDTTYILFSSDHGYKQGQWRIGTSKQHPYETDIRVPFIIRGPGIEKGGNYTAQISGNVDVFPTMLDLAAGLEFVASMGMDGKSMASFLVDGVKEDRQTGWRDHFLNEYLSVGTYYNDHSEIWQDNNATTVRCGGPPGGLSGPRSPAGTKVKECVEADGVGTGECYFVDSTHSNSWRQLRIINASMNWNYVEYDPSWTFETIGGSWKGLQHYELYDVSADPYQVNNIVETTPEHTRQALHEQLQQYFQCSGSSCP